MTRPILAACMVAVSLSAPAAAQTHEQIQVMRGIMALCHETGLDCRVGIAATGANTMGKNVAEWCRTHATTPDWAGNEPCPRPR